MVLFDKLRVSRRHRVRGAVSQILLAGKALLRMSVEIGRIRGRCWRFYRPILSSEVSEVLEIRDNILIMKLRLVFDWLLEYLLIQIFLDLLTFTLIRDSLEMMSFLCLFGRFFLLVKLFLRLRLLAGSFITLIKHPNREFRFKALRLRLKVLLLLKFSFFIMLLRRPFWILMFDRYHALIFNLWRIGGMQICMDFQIFYFVNGWYIF